MKKIFYTTISIILLLFIIIFTLQNDNTITVNILSWKLEGSLAWVVFLTFLAGIVSSLLIFIPKIISLKMKLKKAEKQISKINTNKSVLNNKNEQKEG